MNDRFIELANKANETVGHTFRLEDAKQLHELMEKFAQLIVRECITVIGEENYTMLTGKAYCTQLKRHFGVEAH